MKIRCVWEHNGNDTILYADNFAGAFTRGKSLEKALEKMNGEVRTYIDWCGEEQPDFLEAEVVQEKQSKLQICDADSDVLFETEKALLTEREYIRLKELALKSAADFLKLYEAVPDKDKSCLPVRTTFYIIGNCASQVVEIRENAKHSLRMVAAGRPFFTDRFRGQPVKCMSIRRM